MIALTANTISGAREMFRNEGFSEFIPKPIERSVLERVLHKVLPEERIHYSNAPVIRRNPTDREKPATMEEAEEKQSIVVYETEGKERTVRPKAAEEQEEAVVTFDAEREEDSVKVNQTEAAGEEPVRDAREDAAYDMNTGSGLPDDEAKLQDNSGLKEVVQEEEEDGLREVVQEEEEDRLEETIQGDRNHPDNAAEEDELDLDRGMREEGSRGDFVSFNRLKRTGVNVKMGLDYCCGDRDFYLEMLQMFQSQSADKKAEINSLYEAANWPDYAVKVHALKSTSLTIGAERLSAFAKLLEYAGKRGDVEYIRRNHQNLMRMYEDICKSIAKL